MIRLIHHCSLRIAALALASACASGCAKSEAATSTKPSGPAPDPRGCVAAILEHEEHSEDRDGVSHDVRYKERFLRCGDHLWTQRILPRGLPPEEPHGHAHREMPPAHEVARLLTKAADGKATLALVSQREKQVIDIAAESHDMLHFNGDWDAASHLIPSRIIASMTPIPQRAAPLGAEWREKKSANGVLRVLWSPKIDFPLEIESEAKKGEKRDRIRVVFEPLPADGELPWNATKGFTRKSDGDFMD